MFNKIKQNIIKFFKKTLKMEKTIKLKKCTPAGKQSSNNNNMGKNMSFVIASTFECNKHYITHLDGTSAGWVYDYEIDSSKTIEELEAEKKLAKANIEELQNKIDWLVETGNAEFNEDEFKVYTTIKLLEQKDLSISQKSKLIAELIKK